MPSRRLAIILILIFIWLFIKVTVHDQQIYTIPLILCLMAIISCYTVGSKIDYWWHSRFPPSPDPKALEIIERYPFYGRLTEAQKIRFGQRVMVFVYNKEFSAVDLEYLPEDIKVIISINAIVLTLNQDDFLLEPFDRIFLYQGAFPSPQYPEQWHHSEMESEDGVLIFAIPQLLKGQFDERQFNPVLYEWARVWLYLHEEIHIAEIEPRLLYEISGITAQQINDTIRVEIDPRAVILHHYFRYPDAFAVKAADSFETLQAVFKY